MRTSISGTDTSQMSTSHSTAYQKVRICQRKCDSRYVPRVAARRT